MPAPRSSTQADWRGSNNIFSALLSAPGVHFAALTADTDFKLPMVKLVHGSFMIKVAWVIRGHSNRQYAIVSNASEIGFDVLDANQSTTVVARRRAKWQSWTQDGVYVLYKHKTLVVRANGWEARVRLLAHFPMHNTAHIPPLSSVHSPVRATDPAPPNTLLLRSPSSTHIPTPAPHSQPASATHTHTHTGQRDP